MTDDDRRCLFSADPSCIVPIVIVLASMFYCVACGLVECIAERVMSK